MAEELSRDERINFESYMVSCGLLPTYFQDYGQSKRNQLTVSGLLKFYSWCVIHFQLAIIVRSIFLLFVDDPYLHWFLGYSYLNHQYFHLIIVFHGIYSFILYRLTWSSAKNNVMALDWIEVFQLLQGDKSPLQLGTNIRVAESLSRYARSKMTNCFYLIAIRMVLASVVLVSIYMADDTLIRLSYKHPDYYSFGWLIALTFWAFLNTTSVYLMATMFDIICFYFKLRFRKIHVDLEQLISHKEYRNVNIKPVDLMRQILIEHDFLCWKIDKYNRYWSYIIFWSLTTHTIVFVYTMYYIYFKNESWLGIITLWGLTFEAFYLFFRMFIVGSELSDEVHHAYLRYVKASLAAHFPIDVRVQVRLLVQRVSACLIGFTCYKLFELTRHNLYHALVHMGQNFFLIVDFIVSQKQARILIAQDRAARAEQILGIDYSSALSG